MAGVAVLALVTTVFITQRTLADASDVVVRGEADSMVAAVASDLADETPPISSAELRQILDAHESDGLRYVALLDREARVAAEAGTPEMDGAPLKPGQTIVSGRRVRTNAPLFGQGRRPRRGAPPLLMVVELEPPVIESLQHDLARILVVAAVAGVVLFAFAIAWQRSAARLAAVERQAARDERLVALGSMSSVMAHELRNPLASLKGHAQLLVEDLEPGKAKTKAERVVADAERLEALTTSLLDFVRDGPIDLRATKAEELVDLALEHLDRTRVTVQAADAPPSFEADAPRLARALGNLVQNALQASDGNVELTIAREAENVLFTVRDHGPGLPSGTEMQIFEPFVTTRVRGTGLGLPVARRIAEQHRGTLVGRNHPEGGAVFELRIPTSSGT